MTKRIFITALEGSLFLASVVLIIYYCYLFGHRVLEGGMLGGDTPYHLALMNALNRYYPRIPFWFPFAGAGSSLLLGYWAFSYYLAIFAAHLTGMTLAQWVRILEFATVPVVCIEIYIYIWVRFKNQAMALMGAFLYPLSSMSWGWTSLAGFFTMQMSSIFYVPGILFVDLYLESEFKPTAGKVNRNWWLLGFFLVVGLGTLVHLSFIPNFYLTLPLYALVWSQINVRNGENRLWSLMCAVKAVVILAVAGVLAGAFILIPQYQYFSLQPYTPTYGPTDTPFTNWKVFLGLSKPTSIVGSFYAPLFISLLTTFFASPDSRSSLVSPTHKIAVKPCSTAALIFFCTVSLVSPKMPRRSEWPTIT